MGTGTPDVNALVAELRERVAERRRNGAYPPGLEHDLEDQARLLLHRRVPSLRPYDVASPLARVREALPLSAERIPPGARLDRLTSSLVHHQTQGIVHQVQAFAEPVSQSLAALAAAVEDLTAEVQRLRAPLREVLWRQAVDESRAVQAAARMAAPAAGSE